MYQTEIPLGTIVVKNVKNWDTETPMLPGFEVFKSPDRYTPVRRFSESRRIM
jgi:hypothetical protein